MSAWIETLDGFLKLFEHEIFTNAGEISAKNVEFKVKENYIVTEVKFL